MIKSLKKAINSSRDNIPGWRTDRKIVVIESDDWGSIRMPSKAVYDILLAKGIRVDLCPYNRYDSLESVDDLEILFNSLSNVRDKNGRHAVITTNTNVANPDFDKIKQSDYNEYHYEPFTETLKQYYPNENVFGVLQQGISQKLIFPQLHGREHVNAPMWLDLLRQGSDPIITAFNLNLFGLSMITSQKITTPYLAALIYQDAKEKKFVEKSIAEGASLFENIFGFKSESFIAPLYTWNTDLEEIFYNSGIKFIQGANSHKVYDYNNNKRNRTFHALGSKNNLGQLYLIRNCLFEPSLGLPGNAVSNCLKEVEAAFFWKKPAVICSHRLNFMGSLDASNRSRNVEALKLLLQTIAKKWPDVEFMSSDELGNLMKK